MNSVFTRSFKITPADIDEMNHVNNVIYLRWVQDVAAAHWEARASDELKKKYAWVVLRHELDYKNPAKLGDPVEAKTWVSPAEGVRSVRHVKLSHQETGAVFVEAVTTWCLVDAITQRPKRIDTDIKSIF